MFARNRFALLAALLLTLGSGVAHAQLSDIVDLTADLDIPTGPGGVGNEFGGMIGEDGAGGATRLAARGVRHGRGGDATSRRRRRALPRLCRGRDPHLCKGQRPSGIPAGAGRDGSARARSRCRSARDACRRASASTSVASGAGRYPSSTKNISCSAPMCLTGSPKMSLLSIRSSARMSWKVKPSTYPLSSTAPSDGWSFT